MEKKLYRTENDRKKLCGVCGGLAVYFDVDPTLVRVAWALLCLFWHIGVLAYFICAVIMPKESDIYPR